MNKITLSGMVSFHSNTRDSAARHGQSRGKHRASHRSPLGLSHVAPASTVQCVYRSVDSADLERDLFCLCPAMHRQPREIQGMERRGRDSILNKDSWCLLAPNDRSDSSIKGKYIAPFYSYSGSYIFDVQGFLIFCKITFKVFFKLCLKNI